MQQTTPLLEYKQMGEGSPIVLLHGLFGSKENLGIIARHLANSMMVVAVDLRNHGKSFHAPNMSYPAMAQDVAHLLDHLGILSAAILGHSMGGKVAMQLALSHPERVEQLIVTDIAPSAYQAHHTEIIKGLLLLNNTPIESRRQADELLQAFEPDPATRQFLLTNIHRGEKKKLQLRLNMNAIKQNQQAICAAVDGTPFVKPTLFIRGGESDYIKESNLPLIDALFPNNQLVTIANAGHMPHAEQSEQFNKVVSGFLN